MEWTNTEGEIIKVNELKSCDECGFPSVTVQKTEDGLELCRDCRHDEDFYKS